MQIWSENKENREALIDNVTKFIWKSLCGAIDKRNERDRSKTGKPQNKGNNKYNNKSPKKRYFYAQC